jgi:hypothetical protein
MKNKIRLMLIGGTAIVAFDAIAAIASRQFGFAYTQAAIGSVVLYGAFGFVAGRIERWKFIVQVGAMLGLIDSTIGWAVSSAVGPNIPKMPPINALSWFIVAVSVVISSLVCALVGGAIGRVTRRIPHAA